jgi:hypothetical protein
VEADVKQQAVAKLEKIAQRLRENPKSQKFRASPATKQMIRNMVGIIKELDHLAPKAAAKSSLRPARQAAPKRA